MAGYSASVLLAVAAVSLPGCGGSKNAGAPTTPSATTTAPQPAKAVPPSPLTPEAQSATGDENNIPRVVVDSSAAPASASVKADSAPITSGQPKTTPAGRPALKVS